MASPTSLLRAEWLVHLHALLHLLAEYRLDKLLNRHAAGHEGQIIEAATAAGKFLDDLDVSDRDEANNICRQALDVAQEFQALTAEPGTNALLFEAQDEFSDSAETLALALDPKTESARAERGPRITVEEWRRRRSS
jgi:hypothetical protein